MDPENLPGVNKNFPRLSLSGSAMYNRIWKIFGWGIAVFALFSTYVWVVNRNTRDMTTRQKILRAMYPVFTGIQRLTGAQAKTYVAPKGQANAGSIHALTFQMNDGTEKSLDAYRGKKILIVDTASDCGYTGQYQQLQALQDKYPDKLVVIGFPANDFKEQEKGTDAEIASFCKLNYGVRFPLASKSSVVKGSAQHPVFQWLIDSSRNGWNTRPPAWNFMKYLLDEEGRLVGVFEPAVNPMGEALREMVQS